MNQTLTPPAVATSDPVAEASVDTLASTPKTGSRAPEHESQWVPPAGLLLAWLLPALVGVYLKWYAMSDLGGYARVARSMGFRSLTFAERLSFFRGELLTGFLTVPLLLLLLNRYMKPRWSALFTALLSIGFTILFAIQLRALEEIGRYISFNMMLIALGWGLHEPGANVGYLSWKGLLILLAILVGIVGAAVWSVKGRRLAGSGKNQYILRIIGELYLLILVILLTIGWKPEVLATPYHQSTFVRAVVSLWKENAVDTGEFARFDFDHMKGIPTETLPNLSATELIARYRDVVHAPAPQPNSAYFGKESGDNVLFFILETMPDEFLPANDDMKQFPNLAHLRSKAFVGTRHYTTLPLTVCALFSVFSSWYPMDTYRGAWGFPAGDDAPDFFPRLNSEGYQTAAFSPIRYLGEGDQAMYRAVGIHDTFVPDVAVTGYQQGSSWKADRMAADIATLHLLESNLDRWSASGHKFAAAFIPQIGHLPYPDSYPVDSTENMRERGRAIIALQDAWLGELMDLLEKRGQLDKTIIVVLGDHGRRSLSENPNLRRGTIDETTFHVPLLIYAPRTLDHTERIPWITSHIDVAPTVLDLLGAKGARDSEQGSAIWNPALVDRTTFFFAQTMFGADGYVSHGKFYMWHYYSDSVYANSQALFDIGNFVPPQSPIARDVTSNIVKMIMIEKAWHTRFGQPASSTQAQATPASALR